MNTIREPHSVREQYVASSRHDGRPDVDTLLQASRRLDWRFMLPDPALRRVAYIGPQCGTLLASLHMFSDSLTVLAENTQPHHCYDLAVVSAPTERALARAADVLAPSGVLYVEVHNPPLDALWRSAVTPAGYSARVKRLGLNDAHAFWHWPNFETCTKIVPLDDEHALMHALGRRSVSAKGELKYILGSILLRTGLLTRMVPYFSIIAHRTGGAV